METTRDVTRVLPFTIERSEDTGDGLTMVGYVAVFDQPTRIDSWEGKFDEVIRQGAFDESLARQTPVLMFDHGHHPLIGNIPIGRYDVARGDDHGVYVEARFHNNWLTEPIRDAIREKSITGMSFRFLGDSTVDRWTQRAGDVPLREILSTSVPEMGPVVFPAYKGTEVAVRAVEGVQELLRDAGDMGCAIPDDDQDIVQALMASSAEYLGLLAICAAVAQTPALVDWVNAELAEPQQDISELAAIAQALGPDPDPDMGRSQDRDVEPSSLSGGLGDEERDETPTDFGRANAVRLSRKTHV